MDTFVLKSKNLIPMGEEKSTQDTLVSMFHTAKESLTHTRCSRSITQTNRGKKAEKISWNPTLESSYQNLSSAMLL